MLTRLLPVLLATFGLTSVTDSVASDTSSSKEPTIMFVCGGNTGRSVMAEWYARHHYSDQATYFSGASGLDPDDAPMVEPYAEQLIVENSDAPKELIEIYRPHQSSLLDLYHAHLILTMGEKYNQRLYNIIDRECASFNLDYPGRALNLKQWQRVCANKDEIKAKIKTLDGCATGTDGSIADAFEKDKPFYVQVRNAITSDIDAIMQHHKQTGQWCQTY
jgi:protein-tyrosine-phosphatase